MKKFLSLLLSLIIIISTAPVSFGAEAHSHTICSSGSCACSLSHIKSTWTAWNGTTSLRSGYYYLTQDITLSSRLIVNHGSTTFLCLNGHKITSEDSIFSIYSTSGLHICDCTYSGSIESTGNYSTVLNNKYFTLWSGKIISSGDSGCAIEGYKGTTTNIKGGQVRSSGYDGIFSHPGSNITVSGGTVHGYYSAISGNGTTGVPFGNITISGGTLSSDQPYNAVDVQYSNFTMTGGRIEGGVSLCRDDCTASISGGTITRDVLSYSITAITGGDMQLYAHGDTTISAGTFRRDCYFWSRSGTSTKVNGGNFTGCTKVTVSGETWIYGGSFNEITVEKGPLYLSAIPSISSLSIIKPGTVSAQSPDGTAGYGGDPVTIKLAAPYTTSEWKAGSVVIRNVKSDAAAAKFVLSEDDAKLYNLVRSGNNLILEERAAGYWGDNEIFWELEGDTLTVSGSGEIKYASSGSKYPWGKYSDSIKHIVIESGITEIPEYAFEYCEMALDISLPDTVTSISLSAFQDCGSLNNLMIPASVTKIYGYNSEIYRSESLTDVYYKGTRQQWQERLGNTLKGSNGVLTMHYLEYTESSATCTSAGLQGYYSFTAPSVYGGYYDDNLKPVSYPASAPALGHRVNLSAPVTVSPIEIYNDSGNPSNFSQSGGKYTSTNKTHGSSSTLYIKAKYPCTLNLSYGVSSEEKYDKLTIKPDNAEADVFSGTKTGVKTYSLAAGQIITVTYSKDGSVSSGNDCGWVTPSADNITVSWRPAQELEPDCQNAVICDYCQAVVKPVAAHNYIDNICTVCGKEEIPTHGTCGENLTWTLDKNGTLTISGTGAMYEWKNPSYAPWCDSRASIKRVEIASGVTSISDFSFTYCTSLTAVNVDEENENYSSENGVLFNKNKTTLIYYPEGKPEAAYRIPDSVTTVGENSFSGCTSLTSIAIPVSVSLIKGDTVKAFSELTAVYYNGNTESWTDLIFNIINSNAGADVGDTPPATFVVKLTKKVQFNCCFDYPDYQHRYSSEATTPATHLTEGVMTYTCPCGDTYTEDIPKTKEHSYTGKVTTPATHLKKGVMTYTCPCGDSYTKDIAKTKEHSYTGKVTTPATHLKKGVMTYTCPCGDTYTKDIAKLTAHSYTKKLTSATCTEKGFTTYTCACGDTYKSDYTKAKGHSYTSSVSKPATCTEKGVMTYKCSSCKHSYTESIPAKGHSFSKDFSVDRQATYLQKGSMSKHCTRSGCTEKTEITSIPRLQAAFRDSSEARLNGSALTLLPGTEASRLLSQTDKGAVIRDKSGKPLSADRVPSTGMTITLADGRACDIAVLCDVDGNGTVSAADARLALRASVGLESYKAGSVYHRAADTDGNTEITASDARTILRTSVGLEKPRIK